MEASLEDKRKGGTSRGTLRVRLVREGRLDPEVVPFGPPDRYEFGFGPGGLEAFLDGLGAASFEVEGRIREGSWAVPVTTDVALQVVAEEETRLSVQGVVEPGPQGPEVRRLAIEFLPALRLDNVFQVLYRLPTVFEDHDVALLRSLLKTVARSEWARNLKQVGLDWLRWLDGSVDLLAPRMGAAADALMAVAELLRNEADGLGKEIAKRGLTLATEVARVAENLPMVWLGRAEAEVRETRAGRTLDFHFSGRVGRPGEMAWSFERVSLPHVILPALRPRLADLLSPNPLATARIKSDGKRAWSVAEVVVEALIQASVDLHVDTDLPRVEVSGETPDLGEFLIWAETDVPARIEAHAELVHDGGVFQLRRGTATVEQTSGRLRLEATGKLETTPGSSDPGRQLLRALRRGVWEENVSLEGRADLSTEGHFDGVEAGLSYRHPHLRRSSEFRVRLSDAVVSGQMGVRGQTKPGQLEVMEGAALDLRGEADVVRTSVSFGQVRVEPTGDLSFESRVERSEQGGLQVESRIRGTVGADIWGDLGAFPELGIESGKLTGRARGAWDADIRVASTPLADRRLRWHGDGSRSQWKVEDFRLEMDGRELELPRGSTFQIVVREGSIATTGLGSARLDVSWDMEGRSPILRGLGRSVEMFVPELRRTEFTLHVTEEGGVQVSGLEGGLYDAHFFNALVRPGSEPKRWLEILSNDEAMDRVEASVSVLSEDLGRLLGKARRWVGRARQVLVEEGITAVRDIIPAENIARVLSRLLCGTTDEQERIYRIVRRVVDGEGLDVPAVRRLIDDYYPDHGFEFEVERGLRILARILAPTEPVPPMAPLHEPPLVEREEYVPLFDGLLAASSVYETLETPERCDDAFWETLARQAPVMTVQQLGFVLDSAAGRIPSPHFERIAMVREIKTRVDRISDSYGGIAFLPQAFAISYFLGQTLRASGIQIGAARSQGGASRRGGDLGGGYVPSGLLGPWECAVLLHSCLASFWQGPAVQVNEALLLDYIASQPEPFLTAVLWEMAHRSPRALAGVLYGFVQMEQDALADPVDVPTFLSERLGVSVPRVEDYLAGGRKARESLFEALNDVARQILDQAEPYVAVRDYVQVARHPKPVVVHVRPDLERLVERARLEIQRADEAAARWWADSGEPSLREEATCAYQRSFDACRELLTREPRAFQWDWLSRFYHRNYEALMVRSVVRNVQNDVDRVRSWVETRSGRPPAHDEQELLEQVVDVLYYYPEDRERLKADPFVRLLVDPPEGRYEFTIVACMGVITQGARGPELKDAFARLEAEHGVRLIRADTQTARTLEYNAAKVEEAVRKVSGPWGYVGYSQGCANGLMAEARLLGGTPEQQELVRQLRARHLLFSALNGSAHGTCGDWKFVRAMSDGDRFLKFYQAVLSRRAVEFALKNIRMLLDSKPFVHSLGGVASLSHAGVRALARDGQFRDDVPTTIIRGIVEPETTPEVLEMLSNWLTKEVESADHDTQVTVWEAVGHPVWVLGAQAEALRRCDMGGYVQRTHHWSPLYYAAEFVITDRDRELAVYDTPKDRHVFPWVEVSARFGIIPVSGRDG